MKTVNRGLSAFCSFLVGVGLGVTIAWHFAKIKYEKIADEEIESMKKVLLIDKEKDNENSEKKNTVYSVLYSLWDCTGGTAWLAGLPGLVFLQ